MGERKKGERDGLKYILSYLNSGLRQPLSCEAVGVTVQKGTKKGSILL